MKKLSCVFVMLSMILASNDTSVTFNEGAIKSFAASPNPGKIDLSVSFKWMNPYIYFNYYGDFGAGIEFQSTSGENPSFSGGFYYIWNDITNGVDYNKYLFSIQRIKTSVGIRTADYDSPEAIYYLNNSMDILLSNNLYLSNQLYIDSNLFNFASRIIYNLSSLMSAGFQFDYKIKNESSEAIESTYLRPIIGLSLLDNQSFGYLKFDKINFFGSYSINLKTDATKKENGLLYVTEPVVASVLPGLEFGLSIFFK